MQAPTADPAARSQNSSAEQFSSLVQPTLQVSWGMSQYCPAWQVMAPETQEDCPLRPTRPQAGVAPPSAPVLLAPLDEQDARTPSATTRMDWMVSLMAGRLLTSGCVRQDANPLAAKLNEPAATATTDEQAGTEGEREERVARGRRAARATLVPYSRGAAALRT